MPILTPLEFKWTDKFGQSHHYVTRPNNTDTQATLDERHAATKALLLEKFPKE